MNQHTDESMTEQPETDDVLETLRTHRDTLKDLAKGDSELSDRARLALALLDYSEEEEEETNS